MRSENTCAVASEPDPIEEPSPIHERAEQNLLYIRDAIARSDSFTAVSGWGMIAMGVIAIGGCWLAARSTAPDGWINTWAMVAYLGWSVGVIGMGIKAYLRKIPIWAGPGRRFVLSFSPAILAGCVLTEIFYAGRLDYLMPAMWLMLYGVAIINGGAYSVRPVPITGLAFLALGVAAAFSPLGASVVFENVLLRDVFLAVGFGGFHLILGIIVAARYGG